MSFSRALPFAVLLACGEAESPRREPGDLALQPDRPADVSATADAAQRPDLGAVPDSATDAAPDLAHAFDAAPPGLTFSPAGRVVDLVLPDNPAHAATLGCAVEARNNGSSLAAVVSLVAQGGLAPGNTNGVEPPALNAYSSHPSELFVGEQFGAIHPLHPLLGHAVGAAEVATIGDRNAQVFNLTIEGVNQGSGHGLRLGAPEHYRH